jgi:hypothetical protein
VLEDLGPLVQRIFSRIASHEGEEARGICSNEAPEDYTAAAWVWGEVLDAGDLRVLLQERANYWNHCIQRACRCSISRVALGKFNGRLRTSRGAARIWGHKT